MKNETFTIKEVTQMLDIEAHVLRYYEKELNLKILRNAQGHRKYSLDNINILKKIKELREQGLELKAIKNMLAKMDVEEEGVEFLNKIESDITNKTTFQVKPLEKVDITSEDDEKVTQFALLMKETLKQALVEYNHQTKTELKEELSDEMNTMIDKRIEELQMEQEKREALHYEKLDKQLRELRELKAVQKELNEKETKKEKVSFLKKLFSSNPENKKAKKILEDNVQELHLD